MLDVWVHSSLFLLIDSQSTPLDYSLRHQLAPGYSVHFRAAIVEVRVQHARSVEIRLLRLLEVRRSRLHQEVSI